MGAFESALQATARKANDDDDDDNEQPAAGPSSTKAADGAAARSVLERALRSLPKHKHIKALTRYISVDACLCHTSLLVDLTLSQYTL